MYKTLDLAKRSGILLPLYHGRMTKIIPNVSATGTVKSVGNQESDGDVTFHLEIDHPDDRGPFRHCELTPCDPDAVRALVLTLKPGDRIAITGDERFDPHHVFDEGGPDGSAHDGEGWWEFHYIHAISLLKE